jgi:hypothetical protein
MRYESADKSACMPRENQAPSVSLHPRTGIVRRFFDKITQLSETSNECDWLLKSAKIGYHSGHKELV